MAYRNSYALRVPLTVTIWDIVINPTPSNSTFELKQEITIRSFCIFVLALVGWFFFLEISWMYYGGFWANLIFGIGYLIATFLIAAPTATKLNGYNLIKPMYRYFFERGYRKVSSHSSAPVNALSILYGVRGLTKDNGKFSNNSMIVFNNGDLGVVLELNGNASYMSFQRTDEAIIDAANTFFKQMKPRVNLTFDSVVAAQRVVKQLRNKDKQIHWLQIHDTNVRNLLIYQKYVLSHFVGKHFKAWHQYLVVRGTDAQALIDFWGILKAGIVHDRFFVKDARKLNYKETLTYLSYLWGNDLDRY